MPNPNYIAGRNFEYDVMRAYREAGYDCLRMAGSHGYFDVVAVHKTQPVIDLIQCKVVNTPALADRLVKGFREAPPYMPLALPQGVHQVVCVKVKGSSKWETYYV